MPVRPSADFLRWVHTCMRVVLNQMKNGFPSLTAWSTNFDSAAWISRSTVGMRAAVRAPVSSIFCPPLPSDQV